jgi:hypothetical protein
VFFRERIRNAAHIKEDEYFHHVVHDNMDSIILSIEEAYKRDSTSAPDEKSGRKAGQSKTKMTAQDFCGNIKMLISVSLQDGLLATFQRWR